MQRTYGSPPLPACPHCGGHHGETELKCAETGRELPLEGRLLDNKFRLVVQLGRGGMGSVWRAENVLVHRTVAIKMLHAEYAHNATTLGRFRQEATAAGRIRNPHICDILDLGQSVLGPYIVMEHMRGRSLAQLLESTGRIQPGLAVLVARQALKGLVAAHDAGIIHRDLKPENIFLHEPSPGRLLVKLVDFGISKFTEGNSPGQTRQGVLMGTPEYMSPEQAEGAANVDARTDVWAMGVVLYRALTGREPFLGPSLAATLTNVTLNEPPPLRGFAPHVDAGLASVVERCLVKDRDQRIGSARELDELLAPYEQVPDGNVLSEVIAAPPAAETRSAEDVAMEGASVPPVAPAPAANPTVTPPAGETWNTELRGDSRGTWEAQLPVGSPGPDPAGSWTLSGGGFAGDRPESSLAGGGGGRLVLWLVVLGLVVGGAWVGYNTWQARTDPGGDELTAVATTEATPQKEDLGVAATRVDVGGDGTGAPSPDLGAADSGAPPPETAGAVDTGQDTQGEGGAESGGDTQGGGDTNAGGDTNGGDTKSGQDTKTGGGTTAPRPDLTQLLKAGRLYAPKGLPPRLRHTAALAHCKQLRREKFGRLTRWRLPSAQEMRQFVGMVDRVRYWTRERAGTQGQTITLNAGNVAWADPSVTARALCVSPRR